MGNGLGEKDERKVSETRTSLYSGLAVFAAALSIIGGISMRDRVEGSARISSGTSPTRVASLLDEVPEGDYFHDMTRLLKREFVEPIHDDRKLAVGAVRGMVTSLADAKSLFMD